MGKRLISPSCTVKSGCSSKVQNPKRSKAMTALPGKSVSLGIFVSVLSFSVCVGGKESVFSLTLPGHLSLCLGFPLYSIL